MRGCTTRKTWIPVLLKLIKNSEQYDEDYIKDRIKVIMTIRTEKAEEVNEGEKLQAKEELEENKLAQGDKKLRFEEEIE